MDKIAIINTNILPKDLANTISARIGGDWVLSFAPETLWQYFSNIPELASIPESRLLQDKVLAIKMLLNTDSAWLNWHIYEKVILTFNDIVPDFSIIQEPTITDLYIGTHLINDIRVEPFSSEVGAYVAVIANMYGVTKLYYPLEWAQKELDKLVPTVDTEIDSDLEVLSSKLKKGELTSLSL